MHQNSLHKIRIFLTPSHLLISPYFLSFICFTLKKNKRCVFENTQNFFQNSHNPSLLGGFWVSSKFLLFRFFLCLRRTRHTTTDVGAHWRTTSTTCSNIYSELRLLIRIYTHLLINSRIPRWWFTNETYTSPVITSPMLTHAVKSSPSATPTNFIVYGYVAATAYCRLV